MNWLLDPIKDHYVDFEGRATRQQYWMFVLMSIVASIILAIIDGAVGSAGVLPVLFQLGILLPSIAIAARRLHDIGKSGWWQLVALVPLIGAIVLIVMLALKSEPGANKYGASSAGAAAAAPQAPIPDPNMNNNPPNEQSM